MRLFLIRHGQTVANQGRCFTGQSDVALTEEGRLQAVQIRPILEKIQFDKVFSSDLSRAVITQQLALPDYTAEQTKLLREFDVGSLVGKRSDEIPASERKPYEYYGGESSADVCNRVRAFFKELEGKPWENVAAFAHSGLIISALRVVVNADFPFSAVKCGNCSIHVFEYDGSRWKLLAWNYMGLI